MFNRSDEARQGAWFSEHHNCTLTPVENQQVGDARDFQITNIQPESPLPAGTEGKFVEMKFDYRAKRSGNLYLETRQTFNNGKDYQRSGMTLAVEQSAYIVFSVRYFTHVSHFVFTAAPMKDVLTRKMKEVRTGDNINGNRTGCWTYGSLLPVRTLDECKIVQLP